MLCQICFKACRETLPARRTLHGVYELLGTLKLRDRRAGLYNIIIGRTTRRLGHAGHGTGWSAPVWRQLLVYRLRLPMRINQKIKQKQSIAYEEAALQSKLPLVTLERCLCDYACVPSYHCFAVGMVINASTSVYTVKLGRLSQRWCAMVGGRRKIGTAEIDCSTCIWKRSRSR